MTNNITSDGIQQAYLPSFRFLESIPQVLNEVDADFDLESLKSRCEQIEFEIAALKACSQQVAELRTRLSLSLYTPDRLGRMRAVVGLVGGGKSIERLRISKNGAVEIVVILSERVLKIIKSLIYERTPVIDKGDDHGSWDDFCQKIPGAAGFYNKKRIPVIPKDLLMQCCFLLNEEKSILLNSLQGDDAYQTKSQKNETSNFAEVEKRKKQHRDKSKRPVRELVLSALRDWHRYETSEFNYRAISIEEMIKVFKSYSSKPKGCGRSNLYRAFDEIFGGYQKYKIMCSSNTIFEELKSRSGDYSVAELRTLLIENMTPDD